MPLFSLDEMCELFKLYQRYLNSDGAPLDVQAEIVKESNGHPASFMILLKFYDECRPDSTSWSSVLKECLVHYMNGAQRRLRNTLIGMSFSEQDHVRQLTTHAADPWETDLDTLNTTDQCLLDFGVIVPLA